MCFRNAIIVGHYFINNLDFIECFTSWQRANLSLVSFTGVVESGSADLDIQSITGFKYGGGTSTIDPDGTVTNIDQEDAHAEDPDIPADGTGYYLIYPDGSGDYAYANDNTVKFEEYYDSSTKASARGYKTLTITDSSTFQVRYYGYADVTEGNTVVTKTISGPLSFSEENITVASNAHAMVTQNSTTKALTVNNSGYQNQYKIWVDYETPSIGFELIQTSPSSIDVDQMRISGKGEMPKKALSGGTFKKWFFVESHSNWDDYDALYLWDDSNNKLFGDWRGSTLSSISSVTISGQKYYYFDQTQSGCKYGKFSSNDDPPKESAQFTVTGNDKVVVYRDSTHDYGFYDLSTSGSVSYTAVVKYKSSADWNTPISMTLNASAATATLSHVKIAKNEEFGVTVQYKSTEGSVNIGSEAWCGYPGDASAATALSDLDFTALNGSGSNIVCGTTGYYDITIDLATNNISAAKSTKTFTLYKSLTRSDGTIVNATYANESHSITAGAYEVTKTSLETALSTSTAITGYTYSGNWYKDSALTEAVTFTSDKIDPFADVSGTALYAKWVAKTSALTFDLTTADAGSITGSYTATYGAAMPTLTIETAPTKAGYTFAGFETADHTLYYKADGTSYANWAEDTASGTTLSPKWTPNTYIVTVNADGGSGTSNKQYTFSTSAQNVALDANPTKDGKDFGGYTITSGPSSGEATISGTTLQLAANTYGAITVKALWTDGTYTITFNANGGSADAPSNLTPGVGTEVTMPSYSGTKTGYTFVGWNTASDGSGTPYSGTCTPSIAKDGRLDLYAEWEINSHTLSATAGNGISAVYFSTSNTATSSEDTTFDYDTTVYYFVTMKPGWTATDGWTRIGATSNYRIGSYTMTDEDHDFGTLSAIATQYDITYNVDGGDAISTIHYNISESSTPIDLAASPTKTGHTFSSYEITTNTSGSNSEISNKRLTIPANAYGDITVKINWTINSYDVSFNMKGHGSAIETQSIEYGSKVTKPSNPTATGYTFHGWYKESACTNEWDFDSDTVSDTTVLYAKWTINSHSLSWDLNGGTAKTSYTAAGTYDYGTAITKPTLTKTGYTFAGWSSAATTMPDSDLTLSASWTANTYSVVFNVNGGSGSMTNQSMTYDSAANLKTNTLTAPSGYTFDGWNTNAHLTGTSYANEEEVVNLTATAGGTVNLYAKWKKTVTLNASSPTTQGTSSITVWYNKAIDSSITAPAKTGYTYSGYYTESSGNGTELYDDSGNAITAGSVNIWTYTTTTLYVVWTPNNYAITYKDQGNVAFSGVHASGYPTTYPYGVETTLYTATKTGYTFGGWFTESTCAGDAVATITVSSTAGTTLYAKWTAKNFTVTLDANGGTDGATTSISVTYDAAIATIASANLPTRENNHIFIGFYDASSDGTKYINADGTYAKVWDKDEVSPILYAHWQVKDGWYLNGTGLSNDGSVYSSSWNEDTMIQADTLNAANPTFTDVYFAVSGNASTDGFKIEKYSGGTGTVYNLTFTGWSTGDWFEGGGVGEGAANLKCKVAGQYTITYTDGQTDCTINKRVSVEIHQYLYNETSPSTELVRTDSNIWSNDTYSPEHPTISHYGFVAWHETTYDGSVWTSGSHVTSNMVLYAYYTIDRFTITKNVYYVLNEEVTLLSTQSDTVDYDENYAVPAYYAVTGYTLETSWAWKEASLEGSNYAAKNITADLTLVTMYRRKVSSLVFNFNATTYTGYYTAGPSNGTYSGTYGLAMPTITEIPTRNNYTFLGYYDAASDGNKYYNADGTSNDNWNKDTESATTLYAHWSLNTDKFYLIGHGFGSSSSGPFSDDFDALEKMVACDAETVGDNGASWTNISIKKLYNNGASGDLAELYGFKIIYLNSDGVKEYQWPIISGGGSYFSGGDDNGYEGGSSPNMYYSENVAANTVTTFSIYLKFPGNNKHEVYFAKNVSFNLYKVIDSVATLFDTVYVTRGSTFSNEPGSFEHFSYTSSEWWYDDIDKTNAYVHSYATGDSTPEVVNLYVFLTPDYSFTAGNPIYIYFEGHDSTNANDWTYSGATFTAKFTNLNGVATDDVLLTWQADGYYTCTIPDDASSYLSFKFFRKSSDGSSTWDTSSAIYQIAGNYNCFIVSGQHQDNPSYTRAHNVNVYGVPSINGSLKTSNAFLQLFHIASFTTAETANYTVSGCPAYITTGYEKVLYGIPNTSTYFEEASCTTSFTSGNALSVQSDGSCNVYVKYAITAQGSTTFMLDFKRAATVYQNALPSDHWSAALIKKGNDTVLTTYGQTGDFVFATKLVQVCVPSLGESEVYWITNGMGGGGQNQTVNITSLTASGYLYILYSDASVNSHQVAWCTTKTGLPTAAVHVGDSTYTMPIGDLVHNMYIYENGLNIAANSLVYIDVNGTIYGYDDYYTNTPPAYIANSEAEIADSDKNYIRIGADGAYNFYFTKDNTISIASVPVLGNGYYIIPSTGSNAGFANATKMRTVSDGATYENYTVNQNGQIYIRSYIDAVDKLYTSVDLELVQNQTSYDSDTGIITFTVGGGYKFQVQSGRVIISANSVADSFFQLNGLNTDSSASIKDQNTSLVVEVVFTLNNKGAMNITISHGSSGGSDLLQSYIDFGIEVRDTRITADVFDTIHAESKWWAGDATNGLVSTNHSVTISATTLEPKTYYAYIIFDYKNKSDLGDARSTGWEHFVLHATQA